MTWSVAGALVLAWLLALRDPESAVQRFGFVPDAAFRALGLTAFSAFFVHAGFWHLLGNVWLLLLTGDDLEQRFGRVRLAFLLAAATATGHAFHAAIDPRGDLPCIGASGGVSGLLVCYVLCWPTRAIVFRPPRLIQMFRWFDTGSFWRSQFMALPAWTLFLLWMVLQLLLGGLQALGDGSISAWAHFGGAAIGIACFAFWRAIDRAPVS